MQTPYTIRAKELADLYKGLRINNLSVDERLDVLLHVKSTCKEFDTSLTREICSYVFKVVLNLIDFYSMFLTMNVQIALPSF